MAVRRFEFCRGTVGAPPGEANTDSRNRVYLGWG